MSVTTLYFCVRYDIIYNMIDIRCNICDTLASVKNNFIYMRCHCCDERRIIQLNEHTDWNQHDDYLYSMMSDDFVYNEQK
jgi:hypothetical protein